MRMNAKKLPIGKSDFKQIIEDNYCYVDKTLFIKEIIDKGDTILLIPRPRRFGKTLNLSMLKYFYDCCPAEGTQGSESLSPTAAKGTGGTAPFQSYKKLFDSLAICKAGKKYLDKMGKYPVIFFSFKTIKELDWETTYRKITKLIQREYLRHDYLLNSPKLKSQDQDYFKKIINLEGDSDIKKRGQAGYSGISEPGRKGVRPENKPLHEGMPHQMPDGRKFRYRCGEMYNTL